MSRRAGDDADENELRGRRRDRKFKKAHAQPSAMPSAHETKFIKMFTISEDRLAFKECY